MSTKNTKIKGDLESRVSTLEQRITVLEKLSKRFTRKKRRPFEQGF